MELLFSVQILSGDNKILGKLEGEIDVYTAPKLREELETIKIGQGSCIVLDFKNVSYMDSAGLGIIVAFYKKVVNGNGQLKLVNLSNKLNRLFEITGLNKLINIEINKKVDL